MRLFTSLSAFALLTLLVFGSLACKSDYPASGKAAIPDGKSQPRQVKTAKVVEMPIGQTVTVNGTLAAYDQTTVGVKVPGRLQTISIDLGSVVHKGQVIAQLEQQDYKLRVQQAEAALAQRARGSGCRLMAPTIAWRPKKPEQSGRQRPSSMTRS